MPQNNFKAISARELELKLRLHKKWLADEEGGEQLDLSDHRISQEINLSGQDLSRANLARTRWSGVQMPHANLSGADLTGAVLTNCNCKGANLSGISARGLYLNGNFTGVNLAGVDLTEVKLREACLANADMSEVNLSGAHLINCNLKRANLRGANLNGADIRSKSFRRARGLMIVDSDNEHYNLLMHDGGADRPTTMFRYLGIDDFGHTLPVPIIRHLGTFEEFIAAEKFDQWNGQTRDLTYALDQARNERCEDLAAWPKLPDLFRAFGQSLTAIGAQVLLEADQPQPSEPGKNVPFLITPPTSRP